MLLRTSAQAPSAKAKRLHLEKGAMRVIDGPLLESKERIGGSSLMELPNIEAAVDLRRRYAEISGSRLEVDSRVVTDEARSVRSLAVLLVALPLLLGSSCSEARIRPGSLDGGRINSAPPDPSAVMLRFSRALIERDFASAHTLLAEPLAAEYTPELLKKRFDEMVSYGAPSPLRTEITATMTVWADRRPGDLGWAYAAIYGSDFSEAVSGVVTEEGLIRQLEWGRP